LASIAFNQLEKQEGSDFVDLVKINIMKLIGVHVILFNNIVSFGKNRYFGDKKEPKGFHILGFDILIDKKGKAFCLEVNGAPSMSIDHDLPVSKDMQ